MASNKKSQYEVVYHSIGDASKKYSAQMARFLETKYSFSSAAFNVKANKVFHPGFVAIAIQKHRNKLLPKFRPGTPQVYLPEPNMDRVMSYEFALYRKDVGAYKKTMEIEKKNLSLYKGAMKACDAAIADMHAALEHYTKGKDAVSMSDAPKSLSAVPDKVVAIFTKLKAKAAKMAAAAQMKIDKAQAKKAAGAAKKA